MSNGGNLSNDAYGHTVTMTTDGIKDSYIVGGSQLFQFAAGTDQSTVYLSIAKQINISMAQSALQDFVDSKYTIDVRWNLNALYLLATQDGSLPNRVAYLKQIYTWAQSIVSYASSYIATINAMTDTSIIASTSPDFTQDSLKDPGINAIIAMGINN